MWRGKNLEISELISHLNDYVRALRTRSEASWSQRNRFLFL